MINYEKHLKGEAKNNQNKYMVKTVYLIGIGLSFIASVWIIDYYARR
jgi:hypothetical protein